MSRHRARLASGVLAVVLVLSASGAHAGGAAPTGTTRIDLATSANPHAAGLPVVDKEVHADGVLWAGSDAATTATASAVCTRCSGKAISVQVLYVGSTPGLTLDNVAVAWTQRCRSCHATSVSLQVAVVTGAHALTTSNRALGVNAACRHCRASAAAYQLVMAGSELSQFSTTTLHSLQRWASGRARAIRQGSAVPTARAPAGQVHALTGLADQLNTELGTRTLSVRVRVSR